MRPSSGPLPSGLNNTAIGQPQRAGRSGRHHHRNLRTPDLGWFFEVLEMIPASKIGGGQNARATGDPGILPGAKLSQRRLRYHRMHANSKSTPKSKVPGFTGFHHTYSFTRSGVLKVTRN
jgi:hypothetical protein